jgi:hypothetical protein
LHFSKIAAEPQGIRSRKTDGARQKSADMATKFM